MQNHPNYYMERCIQLAALGLGATSPNPLVGAVLVKNDIIISEGYHQIFGGPHAEVNALVNFSDAFSFEGCTLYVNLEPCSHYGKTPPCSDLIISKKIPTVVVGMQDPFSQVNGEGIRKLRENGIEVISGVKEQECRFLNRRFITFQSRKRPYIILKWAESADRFIGKKDKQVPISGALAKAMVHQWRSEEQGILVGAGTVLSDNPQLNVRNFQGRNPVRIILDRNGRLNGMQNLNVLDGNQETIVITAVEDYIVPNARIIQVAEHDFMRGALNSLHASGLLSILVEGGKTIHEELLRENLWDECRVFKSTQLLNEGVSAPGFTLAPDAVSACGNDDYYLTLNPYGAWV
jgi:diaminohydroxyphosphoribosylaminopyrimidine deaminase/5-amino-6-(5-phosphoribosylamino)uracil reductase